VAEQVIEAEQGVRERPLLGPAPREGDQAHGRREDSPRAGFGQDRVPGPEGQQAMPLAAPPGGLETQSIPPGMAEQMDLARQTIVLVLGSQRREFEKGRVVLGRGRQADFQLDDPNVSRRHAAVYWENGRLFLKDLGSTNGTLLNGRPVTAGPLSRGDVITLGGSEIAVETG
jgi:pSer/pThr/pTyr-binding forkhead associated (FHA) protein